MFPEPGEGEVLEEEVFEEEEEEEVEEEWEETEEDEEVPSVTEEVGHHKEARTSPVQAKESSRSHESDDTLSVTDIETCVVIAPEKVASVKRKKRKTLSMFVKFLLPGGDVYVEEFKDSMTMIEIKSFLGRVYRVNRQELFLYWGDKELFDLITLNELPVNPRLQIATVRLGSSNEFIEKQFKNIGRTKAQKVTIRTADGMAKVVEIVVEDKRIRKPFLGGFREKKGGLGREFHHASCQTKPFSAKETTVDLAERDAQTVKLRSRGMCTVSEKATQMFRDDHYIPCEHDVIKTPGQYVTAAEMERRRDLLRHVRTIQRYWRAWLIWRAVKRAAQVRRQQLAWEEEAAAKKDREKDTRLKRDIVVKAFPRTRGDFEMLYQMVEDWRRSEIDAIKKTDMCEAAKKARYFDVLQKEIELLRNVERHRLSVKEEFLKKKEVQIIEKCSKPITWTGYKGLTISMDTLRTQRARDLTEIYNSLHKEDLSVERRLDLLMHLKKAMEPYTYKEVDDVVELINRECDLLVRSLSGEELDVLRKRFKQLFLKILMMPIFNPETAKYSMEYNNLGLEFEMFRCTKCDNLLPRSKFYPSTKSRRLEACLHCAWLENIAIPRIDLGPYRYMLRAVRRDERRRGCYSSVAFVMQVCQVSFTTRRIHCLRVSFVSVCI